ncbi:hypothetical protein ABZX85_41655 [Streptomyces sp. NPDC004539]|uniref:hypothetical protein n=1 Tax=Streptomyces sp. NPDC004539 TaxID=3154280 RepID=UPI0033B97F23
MTPTERALRWLYLFAGAFITHCAVVSVRRGTPWYGAAFFLAAGLMVAAAVRDYLDADERRTAAVRAERAARIRALADEREMRRTADAALSRACCERWWTSCGTDHDLTTCTRKDTTA